MKDAIEQAIEAVNPNYATPTWDADKLGQPKLKHRKRACPYCGFHRQEIKFDDEGKKYFQCERCEKTFDRVVYKKNEGATIRQTNSGKSISDYVKTTDTRKLKRLSHPALLWLEWAHSAKYSGDVDAANRAHKQLRKYVYTIVTNQVKPNRQDAPEALAFQLLTLIEVLLDANKSGRAKPAWRSVAEQISVNHTAFSRKGRWQEIAKIVQSVFCSWEDEIIDAFSRAA